MDILFYALIAGLIAYRLYTTLGQRNGSERPRQNPFTPPPFPPQGEKAKAEDKNPQDVLALPIGLPRENPLAAATAEPAAHSLAGGLHAIRKADATFDEKEFLKGARIAFEIIVHGFASGERSSLKNLMSARIYNGFDAAITARETAGEKLDVRILSVRDAVITDAKLIGDEARITVQFLSEQKKVTSKDGAVTHEGALEQLTDIWTFRRDTKSADPNWTLVETRGA